ncbi:M28 family peptidase [Candidatus Bipolaricaulota bacterium]|nr:M28 family peptidase [Candidatus Bipolaricaulota bacterium]
MNEALLTHVEALAREIGPRGTGTKGEEQAAHYVREQLQKLGLAANEQRFLAVGDMNWFPISAALLALCGTMIYSWAGWTRWLGALLAGLAAVLLWWAIVRADSPIRFLLPRVPSRNIVARIAPKREARRRAVVLSHLDSNRCRLAWCAGKAKTIKYGSIATLAVYSANGLLYFLGAATGWHWPYLASFPGAFYVLATLIVLLAEMRRPYSPGANDNAASVAVNLGLAERLTKDPLEKTEVFLAFTGAEEVDHRGLKVLLKEHTELREALFIDLEGVGGGDLCYLTKEGLIKHYWPDPGLLKLAEETAKRRSDLQVGSTEMLVVDEVQTLRRLGYRAICLAGRDSQTDSLPRWHTCEDTVEHVSAAALGRAAEFAWEMLQEIDR